MTDPRGALAGVRVLDLTSVFMGPYASQMLADLGADVIKIEPPAGDLVRAIGPHGREGLGPTFLNLNRNKRSVVLDLKRPAAREALLALVPGADVLLYNVRPAAMQRLGLDYETLSAMNPRLVYVGTFGYSQRGRYAAQPAFDDLIQAASGIAYAIGEATDGTPRYLPVTIADRAVGLYAFGVVCAALVARDRTGRGQRVDVPMFETMTHFVMGDHLFGHTFEPPQGGFGYPRLMAQSRRPYRTRDGWVSCTIYTDRQWKAFLAEVGEPERYERDPRFADLGTRTRHIEELYRFVEEHLQKRTTEEWQRVLEPADIPVFPMHTFETLLADRHLADIDFFATSEHPRLGTVRQLAHPSEWSDTPPSVRRHAPSLGEHTVEVLREAGLSAAQIAAAIEEQRS